MKLTVVLVILCPSFPFSFPSSCCFTHSYHMRLLSCQSSLFKRIYSLSFHCCQGMRGYYWRRWWFFSSRRFLPLVSCLSSFYVTSLRLSCVSCFHPWPSLSPEEVKIRMRSRGRGREEKKTGVRDSTWWWTRTRVKRPHEDLERTPPAVSFLLSSSFLCFSCMSRWLFTKVHISVCLNPGHSSHLFSWASSSSVSSFLGVTSFFRVSLLF